MGRSEVESWKLCQDPSHCKTMSEPQGWSLGEDIGLWMVDKGIIWKSCGPTTCHCNSSTQFPLLPKDCASYLGPFCLQSITDPSIQACFHKIISSQNQKGHKHDLVHLSHFSDDKTRARQAKYSPSSHKSSWIMNLSCLILSPGLFLLHHACHRGYQLLVSALWPLWSGGSLMSGTHWEPCQVELERIPENLLV